MSTPEIKDPTAPAWVGTLDELTESQLVRRMSGLSNAVCHALADGNHRLAEEWLCQWLEAREELRAR